MELFEAIYRRGSYRDEFMPDPIPEEDLHRILDAGIRARPAIICKQPASMR